MNTATARVMAIIITAIALVMSGMAGWYRGSSLLDRMLLISISVAIWVIYFLLLSIFLLLLCFFFPTDANRWLFIVASVDFLVLEFMKLTAREKDKFTNRQIAFF